DLAAPRAQGGAHLEPGERGVGPAAGLAGQAGQAPEVGGRGGAAPLPVPGARHACFAASWMIRFSASRRPIFTFSPTARTSRWSSFFLSTPEAMLVRQERPSTRSPMWRAA